MPRYFFNVAHQSNQRDDEGTELADDAAAWSEATRTCGEMIREMDGKMVADTPWIMEVSDEGGTVFTLTFYAHRWR